jgi:hypothetical protein
MRMNISTNIFNHFNDHYLVISEKKLRHQSHCFHLLGNVLVYQIDALKTSFKQTIFLIVSALESY